MKFYEIEIFFKMTIDTISPYSEEIIESYDIYSNEKILDLLDKNHQSFKNWKKTDFSIRSKLLNDIALKLEKDVEEHAELKAKIETGEITRQEANTLRVEFIKNQQNNFKELKADLKERRMHFQEQNAEARGFIKLMDVKGESDDKQKSRGYIKIQGVEGEARATNFLELGDIKGETRNDAQARLEAGAVGSIGFDPVGTRALQAFPDIKADINAAANFRVRDIDKATPKLQ